MKKIIKAIGLIALTPILISIMIYDAFITLIELIFES